MNTTRECVTCARPEQLDEPFIDGQCPNCIRFGVPAKSSAPAVQQQGGVPTTVWVVALLIGLAVAAPQLLMAWWWWGLGDRLFGPQ